MTLDMPVIESSDEARDRARELSLHPKSPAAVSAIADSGLFLDMAQNARPVDRDKINQSLAIERVRQEGGTIYEY